MSPLFTVVRRLRPCLLLLLAGCVEPYVPAVIDAPRSLLVVDGFINTSGTTSIHLSRSYNLSAATAPPVEAGASVAVQEEAGRNFTLRESSPGAYVSAPLTLTPGKRYRLQIRTAAGLEYTSDYAVALTTPAIDAVTWRATNQGLTVYASTHDAANATRYYRWEAEETWEVIPAAFPIVEFYHDSIRYIRVPYPTKCWGSERPSTIRLAKTTSLSQDVVAEQEIKRLDSNASRLFWKYSILVRQYAQSREEYTYWELLKKNTESIGTLFDPLPVQLTGNVHNLSDATEPVLGYVGAHSTTEKRLFIDRAELPKTWDLKSGYESCFPPDTVGPDPKDIRGRFGSGLVVPVSTVAGRYTAMNKQCVDCRNRGTAVRPSFWP